MVEPQVLLAALRSHLAIIPDFDSYSADSRSHQEWLGKAVALIRQWDQTQGIAFRSHAGFLATKLLKDSSLGKLMTIIYEAIADLELQSPQGSDKVFGPGALYDFFKSFRDLILSAKKSVIIVDPYMNVDAFDKYVKEIPTTVSVWLLVGTQKQHWAPLASAVEAFNKSYYTTIQVRQDPGLHDRVVIVDDGPVWVLGQSIKDAAKKSPTYLAPLDVEMAVLKRQQYVDIWERGVRLAMA
jgi:hypothetical protein